MQINISYTTGYRHAAITSQSSGGNTHSNKIADKTRNKAHKLYYYTAGYRRRPLYHTE